MKHRFETLLIVYDEIIFDVNMSSWWLDDGYSRLYVTLIVEEVK